MFKKILSDALAAIKPSKEFEKEVHQKINDVVISLNKSLKGAKAILGGSGVKGTWLKDAYDADIFVAFQYRQFKNKSHLLSDLLEKQVKKHFPNAARIHGSRDYFEIRQKEFTIEIIPILGIKKAKEALNITDVSPLHSAWVNKKGKGLKDDIRLLKQFCKAAKVYGAESFIHGLSGYVCEILVIYFGGFLSVVRNAAKWAGKIVLDPEKQWKGKNILMELNASKIDSPLVVIDPVQADRNASAALSREKFAVFVNACKSFLKSPSKKFFELEKVDEGSLKKKAGKAELAVIEAQPYPGKRDVVGCQLKKVFACFKDSLQRNDFPIKGCDFVLQKPALLYFIIEKKQVSPTVEIVGPPCSVGKHVENFKKAHKTTFIKNKRVYAIEPRKFKTPQKLLEQLKKEPLVKANVRSLSIKWL